jgi:hypothetical protein
MTAKRLRNQYPHLGPHERFHLVVEAATRGDQEEVGLLAGSCPRHTYRATDVAYTGRLEAASRVALTATILLLHAETGLAPVAFLPEVWADGREACEAAGGELSEFVSEDQERQLDAACRGKAAIVLGVCDGLERFSSAQDLESTKLLGYSGLLPLWESALRLQASDVEPDPTTADCVHDLMKEIWSTFVQESETQEAGASNSLTLGRSVPLHHS